MVYRLLITVNAFLISFYAFSQENAVDTLNAKQVIFTQNSNDESQNENSKEKLYRNSFEVSARLEDYYNQFNNRTFIYLQYGRHSKRSDFFLKSLRYTLGDFTGYQFESELYWRFKKQGYTYVDATWSDSFILPNYRFRVEVFQNVKQIEYSLGAGVVKPHSFREIPLVTGTLGYYFGNYFVYVRPTFSYVDGITKSLFVQGRRYFSKHNFIALGLLRGADTGTSRNLNAVANQFGADTYMARLNGQVKIKRYKISAGIDHGGIYIPERNEYARFFGFDVTLNREF